MQKPHLKYLKTMTEDKANVRWWEWANDMERRLDLIRLLHGFAALRAEWTHSQAQVVFRIGLLSTEGASPWGAQEVIYSLPKWELARLDWRDLGRAFEETLEAERACRGR